MTKKILLIFSIFVFGAFLGFFYNQKLKPQKSTDSQSPKDKYLAFLSESYDLIKENYWQKLSDSELVDLFTLANEKLIGKVEVLKKNDKKNLEKFFSSTLSQILEENKKKEYVTKMVDLVLINLKPNGRSRLYTKKEEKALAENVQNITDKDHYKTLDVKKEASQKEVEIAYEKKKEELEPEATKSPEAARKLEEVKRAYEVLKEEALRKNYDLAGIEPTMSYELITPEIYYIHLKKFSPTTIEELVRVTDKVKDQKDLNTLILDLRDNIGGAIDGLPYLLGPFIGYEQYAYQFFHQGEKTDFKTRTGWLAGLVRFKNVVILINEGTQSSAEVMASVLKKYHTGILVGTKTKGWGSVEQVFPLKTQISKNEKFSLFLVHSLTLREDGEAIEGNGVEPLININSPDWEKELYSYFHYQALIETVKKVLTSADSP